MSVLERLQVKPTRNAAPVRTTRGRIRRRVGPTPPPRPASPRDRAPTAQPARDYRLDNAKFILIVLVVIGHFTFFYLTRVELLQLSYWIYLFHMPAFVFISGYFTKHSHVDDRRGHAVLRLLLVYLLFESVFEQLNWLGQTGRLGRPVLLKAEGLMWFLLALAIWRMMAPYLMRLRYPVTVSVGASLLAGMVDGLQVLSLNRVLGMLPFFVLGMRTGPEHLRLLERRWARPAGLAVLAGSGVLVTTVLHGRVSTMWLFWRHTYSELGVSALPGLGLRLAHLVGTVVLVAAVLAVVPRRRTWMSGLGQASIYGYLLHNFVLRLGVELGVAKVVSPGPGGVYFLAGSALVTAALCSPPVRRLVRPVVEPRLGWMVRRAD